ncbi:MAG: VWA domain-containing protein, partial [Verrucomicrobiaceae bacterium]|nr:VWA domain-containing protein [Verrucomicrobiaceae bacterium]
MSLLAPAFLWSLLALLPLTAIYFLKVKPRRRTTSAFFLWDQVIGQKKATSLLQRLRDALSLLLMMIAFAAISFSLANPEFSGDKSKDLLILVDHSASMSATNGRETRLTLAKEKAREIVAALNGNQRVAVASIAGELNFRSHLSRNPRELIDAIDGITESDFPFAAEVLDGLSRDAHRSRDHRILLLSDGSFDGVENLPETIELVKTGSPLGNAGIISADLQRLPDDSLGFFFRIASSFDATVEADLVLKHDGSGERIYKLVPLRIEPGENPAERFTLENAPAGAWVASLEVDDALAKDNVAYLTVSGPRPVRVKVATRDRFFFEVSVVAFEEGSGLLQLVDEAPEVEIAKGAAAGTGPAMVIFTPEGESPWWDAVGEAVDVIAPRVLSGDHPVIRHLDASALTYLGVKEIALPMGALVLVESESGVPLIYRMTHEGRSVVVVNFDPVASEFVLSPWFPVLIHGAAVHLAGRGDEPSPLYRPGDLVPVPGYREGRIAKVTRPGSSEP